MRPGRAGPGAGDGELLRRWLGSSTTTAFLETDARGAITAANVAFAARVGCAAAALPGTPLAEVLAAGEEERVGRWLGTASPPDDPVRINFVSRAGSPFTLRCVVAGSEGRLRIIGEPEADDDRAAADEMMRLNNELATVARERARRERELRNTRRELEQALDDLRTSYWHLQKIQEVLPLCMKCGNVKTDTARWQPLIQYLKENEIFISHGYCPTCADEVMREFGLEGD